MTKLFSKYEREVLDALQEARDGDQSLYERVLNAVDMQQTITYLDPGTADERPTTIITSSSSLGVTFTDTYTYAGSAGAYRPTSIVRSQN